MSRPSIVAPGRNNSVTRPCSTLPPGQKSSCSPESCGPANPWTRPAWPSAWACAPSTWSRSIACVSVTGNACWTTTTMPRKAATRTLPSVFWSRTWPPCASRRRSSRSAKTATTSSGPSRAGCSTHNTSTSNCARLRCSRRPAVKSIVLASTSAMASRCTTGCSC
ncbi:hypothetical protein D3C73_1119160 [compost metagenome]